MMATSNPHDDNDAIVPANGSVGVKAGGELEGSAFNPMGNAGVEHWKSASISSSGFADQDNIFFAAVEMTRMPMVVTDPRQNDNPIVFTNGAFLDLTGYASEEVIGKNCRMLQGPDSDAGTVAQLRKALAEQKAVAVDILNYKKDGTAFWNGLFIGPVFDKDGKLLYFFASQIDITSRRNLEISSLQAQKMEAIGQLTAGLAHDFNNLLHVAMGNQQMAGTMLDQPELVKRSLDRSHAALKKAAKLTQQLLTFARRQRLEPKSLNLNNLIVSFSDILLDTLGDRIGLQLDLNPGLPSTSLDPHQFEVALLNTLINARDAMPEGGRITIGTALLVDPDTVRELHLPDGRYVIVCISDEGEGMSREVIKRATEPFFTTKGPGTGLGLAMVHGFVEQSNGRIEIESEVGKGTRIKLIFPATPEAVPEAPQDHAMQASTAPPAPATRRILIVDDHADVREVSAVYLSSLGYDTIEAESGEAALDIMRQHPVDLVFSDIIMPGGMNGLELIDEIRRDYAGTATLAATGYAENLLDTKALPMNLDILPKPYSLDDLASKVARLLGA